MLLIYARGLARGTPDGSYACNYLLIPAAHSLPRQSAAQQMHVLPELLFVHPLRSSQWRGGIAGRQPAIAKSRFLFF